MQDFGVGGWPRVAQKIWLLAFYFEIERHNALIRARDGSVNRCDKALFCLSALPRKTIHGGSLMWRCIGCCLMMCLLFIGCKSEPTIEGVPVAQISIQPKPEESNDIEKNTENSEYGLDGVRKASDSERLYGSVVPVGWQLTSRTNIETRFHVDGMSELQISEFLEKYFPYQIMRHERKLDLFYVEPEILEEYAGDKIIPSLDLNVFKPETPLLIKVYYNKRLKRYEWIYRDPASIMPPEVKEVTNADVGTPTEDPMMIQMTAQKLCDACEERHPNTSAEDLAEICRSCDEYRRKLKDIEE